jgi:hypothetical protein
VKYQTCLKDTSVATTFYKNVAATDSPNTIADWTVTEGSVDYIASYWVGPQGSDLCTTCVCCVCVWFVCV